MVHGIVKSNHGEIKLYSEPGKGTTVNIYLPCIESDGFAPKKSSREAVTGGNESILIVDDEEYIVTMLNEMLERLGYHVTRFTDSTKAFAEFRKDPYRFDLIITDQTMPKMTGTELAEECMRIRPDLPVVVCTGFSEILSEEKARAIGISEYVTKPVVKKEIASDIRNALATRRS